MEKIYGDEYNKDFGTYAKGSAVATLAGMLIGGIGKGIAIKNQKKAEEIYNSAKDRYLSAYNVFKYNTERTKKTITNVVYLKKKIMCNYMKNFLNAYKRLDPKMRLRDSQGLGELRKFMFDQEEFKEVKKSTEAYLLYDERQLGERAANVALLMVQDGTISNLMYSMRDVIYAGKINDDDLKKSSMDNLKIQSIGVIAEFSTLAVEFGFSGISDAFYSGTQVNEAKEAAAQFEYQAEVIDTKNIKINAIDEYAKIHLKLFHKCIPLLEKYVTYAVQIIRSKDNIFHLGRIQESKFTQNELDILAFTCSLVGMVKAVVDSPIISKSGEVFDGNKSDFINVQNYVQTLEMRGENQCGEMIYCDVDIHIPNRINELFSDETEKLLESGDIDEKMFEVALWEASANALKTLLSPENWLKKLVHVYESMDSGNKKFILSSYENFLEAIDLGVWRTFFSRVDAIINVDLSEMQIDREEALLLDFFDELINKMEDAVNDYYNDVRLSLIVCNLKGPIENFIAEVEYDMKTIEMMFDY